MARITTIPLFKSRSLSAGDSCTSDPIDLRYCANNGLFALATTVVAGTSGTCGTTVFTYTGASIEDGVYCVPAAAVAIGTCGTAATSDIKTFEPELMAFMKIIATQTGAGTAGANSRISANLLVQ